MDKQQTIANNSLIYYRLVALWVLSEAMLGGIIHGFRIPVSGLIVGSCAVICICLIAWYVPEKGAIFKATVIVAIFKMMLSPQAPLPAYVAVFFQGFLGEALFWRRRFYKLCCILLAVLSLLESGFQRILKLTIIYGNDLWTVVNESLNNLTEQKVKTNYSLWLGGGYVALHLVMGIFVGLASALLPARIARWSKEKENRVITGVNAMASYAVRSTRAGRRKRMKTGLFLTWLILIALYAQSYLKIGGSPLLSLHLSLRILLRSIIIVLTWYFIAAPLLKKVLHYWLKRRKAHAQQDVQRVLQLLPSTMQLVAQSWKSSDHDGKKGWTRFKNTVKKILVNALQPGGDKPVWILTGMVHSGKTTSLKIWSENRDDVSGILTPVVEGKRIFMNAKTREEFPMEANNGEADVLQVGKFVFSKTSFNKAEQVIREQLNKQGWLLVDEIGPMELRGEGFYEIVKEALQQQQNDQTIVLVVREGLVEKVKERFCLQNVTVIKKGSFREGW